MTWITTTPPALVFVMSGGEGLRHGPRSPGRRWRLREHGRGGGGGDIDPSRLIKTAVRSLAALVTTLAVVVSTSADMHALRDIASTGES